MKVLHLADLHLGKTLYKQSLLEEQQDVLDQAIDIIKEEKIELVIIAGDIYDKIQPSRGALKLFDSWITEVLNYCPVAAIAGNHDNPAFIQYGSKIFERNKFYMVGNLTKDIKKITFNDEYGPLNVYLLPYYYPNDLCNLFKEEYTEDLDETKAFQLLLNHQNINKNERNILVMHAFIVGIDNIEPEQSGSENMTVGTKEMMSYRELLDFDYVALGHLHRYQQIGDSKIRYAGTPYPYSITESKKKYFVIVDFQSKGEDPKIEAIPIIPKRNIQYLKGTYGYLKEQAIMKPTEDYVALEITMAVVKIIEKILKLIILIY